MTDTEINIAIAEACGLFKKEPLRRTTRKGKKDHNGVVLWYCEEHHGGSATYARVPDYLNDLNAMHEAEKTLRNQFNTVEDVYWRNLSHVKPHPIYATSRQRAGAFLRTIGKWVD